MKRYYPILLLLLCWLTHSVQAANMQGIPEFIDEMVVKHQFKRGELEMLFSHVQYKPSVIAAITRPATIRPWLEYRASFVNAQRVQRGLEFWRKHAVSLQRAEQQYGVPQEIIIAIIGVETIYGKNAGTFRTIDALTTLAFDYPRRAEFFRSELENYLLLAQEQQFNLLDVHSSYAGAMGIPQFMPSSYRKYAVDFNGNHKTDLLHEDDDAIGSVANYMQGYGWLGKQNSQPPIAVQAQVINRGWITEMNKTRTFREWALLGVTGNVRLPENLAARLADYTVADGKEYWLVFNNFEVITKYNNSDFYAMSVFQLAEELKAARKA
ncbi:MAG: lytic murein transglycosylase B, partial [Gallionella sp.]|nr:lytic murein transglycosylase B [Gallionella sp.]